jgi:hypothetical protein
VKPFARTAGRDASKDVPPPFDIARFYYEQRQAIAGDAVRLRQLIAAVDCPGDLGSAQWAQWYSVVLGFEPDLILELGRGYGNSTAMFAQAAYRIQQRRGRPHTRLVSLCGTGEWASIVTPRLARVVEPDWFANVDARRADILSVDYGDLLRGYERVLVLWDAHGFEIADVVLGDILPRLAGRPHLILMHDISDNRYPWVSRSYGDQPIWKGSKWQQQTGASSRVNVGWMNSQQDQIIALGDFASRNELEIGSGDQEYAQFFEARPDRAAEMTQLLGEEFYSVVAQWAFLSLSGREGPFHFPAVADVRAARHRSGIVTPDLPLLPATISTTATPWAYAAKLTWHASAEPPSEAEAWVKCRLRVQGGPVGVGLLTPDESSFVRTQVVSESVEPIDVMLPVPDPGRHGPLVIHTWDAPQSAKVRIDELALIW